MCPPGRPLPGLGRLTKLPERRSRKEDGMFETIVALAILSVVGYYAYRNGKQIGSRKGFGVGRYRRK